MESAVSTRLNPDELLGPKLWRASEQAQIRTEATGYHELDRILPGGGWPIGAVSEILHGRLGVGELSLALPLLARLTQKARPVALISPPLRPYAPRLAASGVQLQHLLIVEKSSDADDALWSAELLLRAGAAAVMLWADKVKIQSLRRLQLAAESMDACALLLRSDQYADESTPSALRLKIWRARGAPQVEVLKCRGVHGASISLNRARPQLSVA